MVDLHCHILPNVDDGAASLDEALAMARFCAADGTTHIFATPHCHRYVHLLRADVIPRVAQLNRQLESAKIPVTILPGSEIQVTDTTAYRREFEAGLYCHLGDGRAFTLLEFNWARDQYPSDAVALIGWIRAQSMTPILAHPERHDYYWKEPALLQALIEAGAWVQVTVDSLLGNHGPAPKVAGEAILRLYPDAVLSTDAHNMGRCSGLSAGYAWVREHLGQQRTDDLRTRADQVLTRVELSKGHGVTR
ncbi:MAG TPA: CpsB/CapC family capsule biosynthesis tyrosine phosphatase [Nitrospiraceae bacterium]|nr:CpsB/CapC family capsule biosynthesis tyrosine phosphatase [Nitrospiraceae bacterium]